MRGTLLAIGAVIAGLTGCAAEPGPSPLYQETPPPVPTSTATPPPEDLQCAALAPAAAPAALLTRSQYDNTILDLLGDASHPSATFPPENEVQGFRNNILAHQASPLLVEEYLKAAEGIATRAVGTRLAEIAPCDVGADSMTCGQAFVDQFGSLAFRRPLTDQERQVFFDLFQRTLATGDYTTAISLTLQAILQSPQFLYRTDSMRAPTPETGAIALGPYELASRLAYFLTDSMPDAELRAAASAGQLLTDDEIRAHALRLLQTPRAHQMVRQFHHQWLRLDSLASVGRDAPELGDEASLLGQDWLTSLDRFIDHVYWERGNVAAFFDSPRVYLTPRLASLYGVATAGGEADPVDLPDRSGLLTQPALLALLAHPDQSAPVLRGVFVRERILCLEVPPPPPSVNAVPPDPDPSLTTRERFKVHTEQAQCLACHQLFDGIGFGFEGYDQLGRYRDTENGFPVDVSGEVYGTNDAALDGTFTGTAELAARLGASQRVRNCIATSFYRYALGRIETAADSCSLDQIEAAFETGDLASLLVAITLSDAFRYRPAMLEGP